MDKTTSKILAALKEKKITPTPKWHFLLKNYVFWSAFIVSIIIGGVSLGVIFHFVGSDDWDIYNYAGQNFWVSVLSALPYFWIFFLLLFLWLSYYDYKHTKYFYRYQPFLVFAFSIALSVIIGIFCYSSGIGNAVNNTLSQDVPYYSQMMTWHKRMMWNQPQRGLLFGQIIDIENKNSFALRDPDGEIWQIKGENILWRGNFIPRKGEVVKILGEDNGNKFFYAREIRPDRGMGAHMNANMNGRMRQMMGY